MTLFVLRRERSEPWDWSRDLREQEGWEEHARIMEAMVEDGFIVLGGPLEGDREVLLIVEAPSEEAVHARLAEDNWTTNGMLTTKTVERWTVLLGGVERS